MTTINIVNTSAGALSFADVTARPSVPVAVDAGKWAGFIGTPVGKSLFPGTLQIEGGSPAGDKSDETDNDDAAKDAIIAQLADLDVKADKRMSLETLQSKLDDATKPAE